LPCSGCSKGLRPSFFVCFFAISEIVLIFAAIIFSIIDL